MFENFLDAYDWKARIAPGLIVAIPLLADVFCFAPALSTWSMFAKTGICGLALIYGIGLLSAAMGNRIQPKLWAQWQGAPSTRYLRHRDLTFGTDLKASIRADPISSSPSS